MVLELQIDGLKRLERLKRSLNASDQDVISKVLELFERYEARRAEILRPAKGFQGMTECEASELALTRTA